MNPFLPGKNKVNISRGSQTRQDIHHARTPETYSGTWQSALAGNYIFPIYTNEMDEEEKLAARKAFLSSATKAMKVIAPKIGIQKNLRFGNARHSTGAILKKNKVSRDFIKDYYGLSITTADNYMDSFDDDEFETIANQFTSLDALNKRK